MNQTIDKLRRDLLAQETALTLQVREYKFKYTELKEQYELLKHGDKINVQDMEHATT